MSSLNKRVFIFLAIAVLVFSLTGALAAVNESEQISQAYNWLSFVSRDKWQNISIEDNAYALLALSYDDTLATQGKDALVSKSKNSSECWPSAGCKVKETALATLALSKVCIDTEKSEAWLMNKNSTPTDLIWYLQVDPNEAGNCTAIYDNKEYKFSIEENKKINNAAGSCLTLGFGSYWFKIASSCYEKTFTVTCDKDFAATLVYQKPSDATFYISSDTKKESSGGYADLKINAICIKEGFSCNYEATLFTALALQDKIDINLFLPYLIAYADKNEKYFPEAYLLKFSGFQDYATQIFDMQKSAGYWLAPSSANDKYYDTALAFSSLTNFESEKKDRAKIWLLNEQVKTGANAGSWQGNKKDTSSILYLIWPKEPSCASGGNGGEGNGTDGGTIACEAAGGYCMDVANCDTDTIDDGHQCSGYDICCKESKKLETCSEQSGVLCNMALYCAYSMDSSDSSSINQCCAVECTNDSSGGVTSDCEDQGYYCAASCSGSDSEQAYSCSISSDLCCASGSEGAICGNGICDSGETKDTCASDCKSSGTKWWLIIIVVLILGVILFLLRGKLGKRGAKRRTGPPGPPGLGQSGGPPMMGRPIGPPFGGRPMPARPIMLPRGSVRPVGLEKTPNTARTSLRKTETDKELDETLKKLEDMSK